MKFQNSEEFKILYFLKKLRLEFQVSRSHQAAKETPSSSLEKGNTLTSSPKRKLIESRFLQLLKPKFMHGTIKTSI